MADKEMGQPNVARSVAQGWIVEGAHYVQAHKIRLILA
jgi:hypothetical protein